MILKDKISRRRFWPLAAVTTALAIGGGFALDAGTASAQTVNAQQAVSQNWSGYSVTNQAGQSFSSVSGSWTQPSVSASSGDGDSAFWVGLGGASRQSQSLEQIGTAADVHNGQVGYSAWYELLPAAQQPLNLAVHPGDQMTGKVTVDGTTVTLSLANQTTGQSATKTLQMTNPDTSSAEWIAEAPAVQTAAGDQILPLADFGKVNFTNASASAGGHTGAISDPSWSVQQIDLSSDGASQFLGGPSRFSSAGSVAQQSSAGASTGTLSGDGSSFTVSVASGGSSPSQSSVGAGSSSGYGDPGAGSGYGDPGAGSGYGYPGGGSGYGYPGGAYQGGDGYAYAYPGAGDYGYPGA
jgi:hypothetical protein